MTRTEILTRYRRLRQISKEHHQAVLDIIAPGVVLDWAKRLGLMQGRTVVRESEHDMTLVEDLATYLPRLGRSHPLDRYARTKHGSLRTPTKRSCSRRCAMPGSPSGVSSGGTKLRA
jgi:hypothetical protein